MGWFDEQIKQRKLSDQEVFEDSFMEIAASVLGSQARQISNERIQAKEAIGQIIKYYHYKPEEIPDSIEDFDKQLDRALRPHGLMHRNIRLEENWYQDCFGAVLAFYKDDDRAVALLPKNIGGYYFINDKGEKETVNSGNWKLFAPDAICFYRPLPLKELTIPDLMRYMVECVTTSDIIFIVGITFLSTLVGFIGPRLSKLLSGPVLNSRNLNALVAIGVFMIAVSVSTNLIMAAHSLIMQRITIKTSISVEAAVMMRIVSLPAKFFRQFSSGELASRVGSVNSLCSMLMSGFVSTGLTSVMSLLYITQIFSFAPLLVAPSLVIILSTIILGLVSTLMRINIMRKQMKLSAEDEGMSYALVSGIQKIKLAGAEKRAFARWANHYAKQSEYIYNPPTFLKINSVLINAISLFGNIILYYLAVSSGMNQSDYFAFNITYGMVSGAFSSLAQIILSIAQVKPILEMAEPILKEKPEMSEGKQILERISGNIEFNNVKFRYEDTMPYVIDDLSLKIRAGEYIAIVGKTGCGKSTLIRLLLGFEKPEKGAIYFDGKDISNVDLKSLRKKIGTVTQNGDLFTGDIYSNIVISAPELTLDQAWEAAEIAGIAEDIREMPMGMQTMISEGDGGISGGQKQRIMIARAIAPKPKVLIFDEATSALDNKTQKQVSDALDALKCTRIVIAHRLSTIRHCDRILVLERGKIIEEGTYEELIEYNGFFAELVERQRLDVE